MRGITLVWFLGGLGRSEGSSPLWNFEQALALATNSAGKSLSCPASRIAAASRYTPSVMSCPASRPRVSRVG